MSAFPPLPAAGEIQVWFVDLAAPPEAPGLLSESERARAGRFIHSRDRDRFVVAHAALRRILGGYLRLAPREVEILAAGQGKPFLGGGAAASGLAFNLSHSGDLAVVACTMNRAVGVDVEKVDPAFPHAGIAERFFSEPECQALRALDPERQLEGFFRQWTCKEAYAKGLGLGLSRNSRTYTIAPQAGCPALVADDVEPANPGLWQLAWLPCPRGYVGAVAIAVAAGGRDASPLLRLMPAPQGNLL